RHRHVPFVGLLLPGNHPEQRRLAGAVGADQADLLAGIQLERSLDEEDLLAVLLADVRKRNHRGRVTLISAPKSMVRSLSRAAHLSSVAGLFVTRPSKRVVPSTITLTGLAKSNWSGEMSSVKPPTPRVVAVTVLP